MKYEHYNKYIRVMVRGKEHKIYFKDLKMYKKVRSRQFPSIPAFDAVDGCM